ncbi:MAG: hypothetical protein H5U17_01090 [Defluviimonas sp.]|nr:hypothetical protein [Defluviimonas sp.]
MVTKDDLKHWVAEAVSEAGGESRVIDIAKWIWLHHESDLRKSGDMFFKWQYDMRWAGQALVQDGTLNKTTRRGYWKLTKR